MRAAEQNDDIAQYNLGNFYEKIKKDFEKAEFWLLKAAEQNDFDAQYELGNLYKDIKKDFEKAEFWYLKAAEQDDIRAQHKLGLFYETIKNDYEKAEFWFLKAAAANQNNTAALNLAHFYLTTKKDYVKALFWYEKASNDEKIAEIKKLINQNKIIEKKIVVDNDDECCICKESFLHNNKSIITIQCSHSFHYDCLKQWKMKCPLCFIDVQ